MQEAINLFAQVVAAAIPYGVTFAMGQMIVNSFMKMAFGGRIEF